MSAADVSSDVATIREITEMLVTGGYDGTEGQEGSSDTTWTDFGIVCGIAERLAARASGRENVPTERSDVTEAAEVPKCGYCHWPFDSFEPGCAQCGEGAGRYYRARCDWRFANRAALDEAGEGDR